MKKDLTTFVCCVESGALEFSLMRTIESLRRFGGEFSQAPILAITPRTGPKLAAETIEFFKKMNVDYYCFKADNRYSWKGFLNKHYALDFAERVADTEYITWIDSDLLFTGDIGGIIPEKSDFIACVPDSFGATSEPGDPMHEFWKRACEIVGLKLEDLPMVTSHLEDKKVRFYFNSGIFTYKRSTNFARVHLDTTLKFFDNRHSSKVTGTFFTQYSLGLAVLLNNMSWELFTKEYNYGMGSAMVDEWRDNPHISDARVIHFHDSLWPGCYSPFLEAVKKYTPEEFSRWVEEAGPLRVRRRLSARIYGRLLNRLRKNDEKKYNGSCVPV
ncbi:MAG: hypothetical protein PQJ60_09470 [Spirochaetales bacterium]|nr:hypothetical protein [Spirochaetales bacterium]